MSDEIMTVEEMKDRALGFRIIQEEGTDYFIRIQRKNNSTFTRRIGGCLLRVYP